MAEDKEGIDYEDCTGCDMPYDIETMSADSENNWFCSECWEELAPVMAKEYQDLIDSGEIEED